MKDHVRGILSCVGGFFFSLIVGGLQIWGNVTVYITSYLRLYDPSITYGDTFITFPIHSMTLNTTMIMGSYVARRANNRLMVLFSTMVLFIGLFLSSYTSTLFWFIV
jgi:hypothetical protein